MPQSPSPHDMRGLIGNTLRIGVSAACLVAFIGGVLYLFQHGAEQLPDYSTFTYGNAPAEYTTWRGIFTGLFGCILFTPPSPRDRQKYSLQSYTRTKKYYYLD